MRAALFRKFLLALSVLAFSVAVFSSVALAAPGGIVKPSVVGGDVITSPNAFSRSTVRLTLLARNDGRGLCTGSLISDSLVVTAAHCLTDDPQIVRVDFFGTRGLAEYRMGTRYLIHENYNDSNESGAARNDLALLEFEGGIPAENQPAELFRGDLTRWLSGNGGATAIIAGYGLTQFDGQPDDQLRTARLGFGEIAEDCIELKPLTGKASGCSGDSGGPAFVEIGGITYVWGVASYVSFPYCEASTFYTNLGLFEQWRDEASSRLRSAPAARPVGLVPVEKRALSKFMKKYSTLKSDQARVRALQAWSRELKTGTGVDISAAMEIFMAFDEDRPRLDGYLILANHIQFESLKQGRTFMLLFNDPELRRQAEVTLFELGIGYLEH